MWHAGCVQFFLFRRDWRSLGAWLALVLSGFGVLLWLSEEEGSSNEVPSNEGVTRQGALLEKQSALVARSRRIMPNNSAEGRQLGRLPLGESSVPGNAIVAGKRALGFLAASRSGRRIGRRGRGGWRPGMAVDENAEGEDFEPLAGKAQLSGLVFDASGGPIVGATITVRQLPSGLPFLTGRGRAPMGPQASATSDTQGAFKINVPPGLVVIEASAEAYAPVFKQVRAPADGVSLVLLPSSSIVGRVQRLNGSAVAGAKVSVRPQAGFGGGFAGAVSDTEGGFQVSGLKAGRWIVEAQAPGLRGEPQWVNLGVAELSRPIEVTLEATHTLSGSVRLAGKPCLQAFVQVGGLTGPAAGADETGHYQVDGIPAGEHSVQVRCGRAQPQVQLMSWSGEVLEHLQKDWDLSAGLSLHGLVVQANGEPAPGTQIVVQAAPEASASEKSSWAPGAFSSFCISDAEGVFECTGLEPGWHRARVGGMRASETTSVRVQVGVESRAQVQLMLPETAEIRVTVLDSEGAPRSVTRVVARGPGRFPLFAAEREGAFVFENLPLGTYTISPRLGAENEAPDSVRVVLTEAGQVVDVELPSTPLASIAGRVLDPQGQPVQDAHVQALRTAKGLPFPMPQGEPGLSDANGWFELRALPVGSYTLRASHSLGEAQQSDVHTAQGEVLLSLVDPGEIAGWVFAENGQPEPLFSVVLVAKQGGEPAVMQGQNGRWFVPWLAAGSYSVAVANDKGGALGQFVVTSDEVTEVRLTLDPELAKGEAVRRLLRPAGK